MSRTIPLVETLEGRALMTAGWMRPAISARIPAETARLMELTLTADLDAASDPLGDGTVFQSRAGLTGQTIPGATVRVLQGGLARPVTADDLGGFHLSVQMSEGAEGLTLQARDVWGRTTTFGVEATRSNAVLSWNAAALEAIRLDKTPPPVASRALAIVQAAVYDAVNAVTPTGASYLVSTRAPRGTSAPAAAASAAYHALVALFPARKGLFDAAWTQTLAGLGSGRGVTLGVNLGQSVAEQVLAARADDGSRAVAAYTPGNAPGLWRPTPSAFASALLPQWPSVRTFVIPSGSQFRPAAPPSLTSAEYASDFNEVKSLGAVNSTTRTAEQTEIAQFWADGAGTETPPGHWNRIASEISRRSRDSLAKSARTLALLDLTLADAAIACWDAKYAYNLWRPVSAIRAADTDGNPDTTADASWAPLLATPPFPSYDSGHSTFSGAAAEVLSALYGHRVNFSTSSDGLPGVTRSFHSFWDAANEAGRSRIYGGIHYQFDNSVGLALGRQIAQYALSTFGRRS